MSDKVRYPRSLAAGVAQELAINLSHGCSRICVAGSIRRGKSEVGDIEIVYVPIIVRQPKPGDMFADHDSNKADSIIYNLEATGILEKRKNVNGSFVFGPKNKLMRHRQTGIPVDLFSTTEESWINYLVCRTGPAESNAQIAMKAQAMGWKWNPYGPGFSRGDEVVRIDDEAKVFRFVRMPLPPPRHEVELTLSAIR